MTPIGRKINSICKRGLDIALSSVALILAAPLMALISAAVWLDSPGPVLFVQERLGLKGRRFKMVKFRKFPPTWGDEGPAVTVKNDVRMTRVGAMLERTKLDELPQFWNVLRGDLSLVGPRPESPRFADCFEGECARLLEYTPGLFGPNQILFRNECELYCPDEDPEACYRRDLFPKKAENDLCYFRTANCFTDIVLIVKGVWVTITGVVRWQDFLRRDAGVMALDALLAAGAWFLASVLLFSGLPEGDHLAALMKGLLIVPILAVALLAIGGCYGNPAWCFSLEDILRIGLILFLTCVIAFAVLFTFHRTISPGIFAIFLFISLVVMLVHRIAFHLKWDRAGAAGRSSGKIVIYGAGRVGVAVAKLIGSGNVVGFMDDNPVLKGKRIIGRPVLGYESDLATIVKAHRFDELWLSFLPTAEKLARVKQVCQEQNIRLYVIPEIEPFSRFLHARDRQTLGEHVPQSAKDSAFAKKPPQKIASPTP